MPIVNGKRTIDGWRVNIFDKTIEPVFMIPPSKPTMFFGLLKRPLWLYSHNVFQNFKGYKFNGSLVFNNAQDAVTYLEKKLQECGLVLSVKLTFTQ